MQEWFCCWRVGELAQQGYSNGRTLRHATWMSVACHWSSQYTASSGDVLMTAVMCGACSAYNGAWMIGRPNERLSVSRCGSAVLTRRWTGHCRMLCIYNRYVCVTVTVTVVQLRSYCADLPCRALAASLSLGAPALAQQAAFRMSPNDSARADLLLPSPTTDAAPGRGTSLSLGKSPTALQHLA